MMDWFERLAVNPHIESVLLADNQGRILRSTRPLGSDAEMAASMLQSAEVLAQALSAEFGCGEAKMLQISTRREHIMLFPLANSTYYLVVQVERTAPLMVVMTEIERALTQIDLDELAALDDTPARSDDTPVLDAEELIEAVREWLRSRPTST